MRDLSLSCVVLQAVEGNLFTTQRAGKAGVSVSFHTGDQVEEKTSSLSNQRCMELINQHAGRYRSRTTSTECDHLAKMDLAQARFQHLEWPCVQYALQRYNLPMIQASMTSSLMGLTNCRIVATSQLRFAQQGGEELGRLAKGSALRQDAPHQVSARSLDCSSWRRGSPKRPEVYDAQNPGSTRCLSLVRH